MTIPRPATPARASQLMTPPRHISRDKKLYRSAASPTVNMEVMSIDDFTREEISELDHVLEGAVDQAVALTQPKHYLPDLSNLIYHFGEMNLDAVLVYRHFDFSLPSSCPGWPGPRFGTFSLHKVISKSEPQEGNAARFRRTSTLPRSRPKAARTIAVPEMATDCTRGVASRSPPLRLLDLPSEIRNLVWTLIAVRKDPIEAQLRRIHPCKKLTRHRRPFIRRFPLEPVASTANKQIRQELLSIFYGINYFVFERNACKAFAKYGMLTPANMLKWKPSARLAHFLTSAELRFNALPRMFAMAQITYTLLRLPDGRITVEVKVEKANDKFRRDGNEYCLCAERAVAAAVTDAAYIDRDMDLADCAVRVVEKRNDLVFTESYMHTLKTFNLYTQYPFCGDCGKRTFEILFRGV